MADRSKNGCCMMADILIHADIFRKWIADEVAYEISLSGDESDLTKLRQHLERSFLAVATVLGHC
jgi:hypothetical protein